MTRLEKKNTIRDLAILDKSLVKFQALLDSLYPLQPETEAIIRVRSAINIHIERLESSQ